MSNQNRYVRLGVFIISAVTLLILGIIVLGVGSLFKHYIRAETYFSDSVQGLDVGAAVKYRGVTVGKVESIAIVPMKYHLQSKVDNVAAGRLIRVVMDINPEPLGTDDMNLLRERLAQQVQAGFRARLASSLTGPASIELDFLDPKAYPPLAISWTPEHLYVPSAPAATSRIVSAVERIAVQLEEAGVGNVVRHVDQLILDANKSVNDLNTGQRSEQLGQVLDRLRASSERIEQILKDPAVDQVLHDVSSVTGSAKAAVGGKDGNLQQVMDNLRTTSDQLQQSTNRVNELVHDPKIDEILTGLRSTTQNAGPAAEDLRQMLHRLNLVVTTQSRDLEAIIRNLREVSANVDAITQDAKHNPSRLLFGEPPRRIELGERQR